MSDTGIVRRVDDLGRVVIPIELRRTLGIRVKDPLSIHVEGERIVLQKHPDTCTLCSGGGNLTDIKGRSVCAVCISEIQRAK